MKSFIEFTNQTRIDERIRKSGDEWEVTDSPGKKVLGRHKSRADALRQLRAIEINKHK